MKAMRIHAFGKPPLLDDLVAPAPVSGHTMIDVHAASVGHIDRSVMSGRFLSTPPLPYVPGVEAAGIVLSSETFEKGQRVWVRGHGLGLMRDGTWCERIAAPDAAIGVLPDAVPMPLGAAFFSPCTSAWVALFAVGRLTQGERVLVTGATGAVGSIAVQLAREAGATVRCVVADEDAAAALPVDVQAVVAGEPLANAAPADLLIDTVGGPGLPTLFPHLVPGGRCVLVGYTAGETFTLDLPGMLQRDIRLLPLNMYRRDVAGRAAVPELLNRLADGRLQLAVRRFALGEAAAALAWITQRGHRGRAVLEPMG